MNEQVTSATDYINAKLIKDIFEVKKPKKNLLLMNSSFYTIFKAPCNSAYISSTSRPKEVYFGGVNKNETWKIKY